MGGGCDGVKRVGTSTIPAGPSPRPELDVEMGLEDAAIPMRGCAYSCERQGSPAAILPDHREHENRRNPVPRGRTFLSSSPTRFLAYPMLTAITHAAMYE